MSEQLNALDATFLELEEADQGAHMHIGGVMVFEPGRTDGAVGARGGCPAGARAGAAAPLPGPALIPDHGRLLLAVLARGRALPGRQPRTGGEPRRRREARRSCSTGPASFTPSASIGRSRSGRWSWSRGSPAGAGRWPARRITAWSTGSAPSTPSSSCSTPSRTGRPPRAPPPPRRRPRGTGAALAAPVADRSGGGLARLPVRAAMRPGQGRKGGRRAGRRHVRRRSTSRARQGGPEALARACRRDRAGRAARRPRAPASTSRSGASAASPSPGSRWMS